METPSKEEESSFEDLFNYLFQIKDSITSQKRFEMESQLFLKANLIYPSCLLVYCFLTQYFLMISSNLRIITNVLYPLKIKSTLKPFNCIFDNGLKFQFKSILVHYESNLSLLHSKIRQTFNVYLCNYIDETEFKPERVLWLNLSPSDVNKKLSKVDQEPTHISLQDEYYYLITPSNEVINYHDNTPQEHLRCIHIIQSSLMKQ